ncbi:MAG: protein kinase [Planctomycetes bacterium]|nr:protein kinase [Planctomycetota bacterium]
MAPETPEERALNYAVAHRVVSAQQVAHARAAAAAGRAPNALAALAPTLAPQQRALLVQVYQSAQRAQPPSGSWPAGAVAPTVNAPPPQFEDGSGVAPTIQTGPPRFADGETLQRPGAAVAPTVQAPPPPFGEQAPRDRAGIENSLATSASRSGPQGGGERVGDFEVVREIARGGVGVVYLARHPTLERLVALKLLLPGTDVSVEALERFKLEAQVSSRLQHPNIVRIYQDGYDQRGRYYFAMDFIEGPSLLERIQQRGQLTSREAATLLLPLAEALAHAHRASVLHRDLKPHNVLIRESDETPFLTDFGLAKDVGGKAKTLTVAGNVMGTPAYMPPEQAGGETDLIDRRSDVYSLGATLYHALTGEAPFGGQTLANVLTAVLTREVVPPSKKVKGVDADLETICMTCLEKEQDARYPTAQALADDLARYLADEPIEARPTGALGRARKWAKRNRGVAWTLAVSSALLVLGGLGGGVYVLDARGKAQQEARATLIDQLRGEAQASRDALERAQPEGVEARLAAALDALSAAQQWAAVAGDDPEAKRASCAAALALAAAAIDGRQLTLAERALSLARDTEVLATEVRVEQERLEEVRLEPVTRARAVLASLRNAEQRPGWRERAVFELSRTPSPEWVDALVSELESFDEQLKDATLDGLREFCQPQPTDPQDAPSVLGVPAAMERWWALAPGEALGAEDAAALEAARSLANVRASRLISQATGLDLHYGGWDQVLIERQARLQDLAVRAEVIATALSRLPDHDDARLRRALMRYVAHVWDEHRVLPVALGLLGRETHADYLRVIYARLKAAAPRGTLHQGLEPFVNVAHADYMDLASAVRLADQLLRGARFAEAESLLARFASSNDPGLRVVRCRAAVELGDLDTSTRLLRELDPALVGFYEYHALRLGDLANRLRWEEIVAEAPALTQRIEGDSTVWSHVEAVLDVLFQLGMAAARTGKFELANRLGAFLSGLAPTSPLGNQVLVYALLAKHEVDKALLAAQQALEQTGDKALKRLVALCQIQLGRGEEAENALRRLVSDLPHLREARLLYAQLLAQGIDLPGARAQVEAALEPYPAWVPGLITLTQVHVAARDEDAARKAYARVVQRVGEGSPEVGLLRLMIGRTFGFGEQPGPASSPAERFELALKTLQSGDAKGAVEVLEGVVEDAPDNQLVRFKLAFVLFMTLHDAAGAQPHAKRAVELDPRDARAWNLYGAIASDLGDDAQAKLAFERVLALQPRDAMAHNNLGWLDRKAGRAEEALEHYRQAIELNSSLALARCNRASLLFELGRVEEALADYSIAVSVSPDDPEVRTGRAEVLLTLGRDRDALDDLEITALGDAYGALLLAGAGGDADARLREYADKPGGYWASALCQAWLGELAPAELLSRAEGDGADASGHLCEAHFYLGWKAERAGMLAEARAHYEAAIAEQQLSFMEHGLAKARLSRLPAK